MRLRRRRRRPAPVTLENPGSPSAARYRALGAAVLRRVELTGMRAFMVTNPRSPGRLASVAAANLGVVLAQAGKRVIVVSGNVRSPLIHQLFYVPNDEGLTTVLADTLPLSQAILPTSTGNLSVLPSGPEQDGVDFLQSEDMQKLITELLYSADVVLMDSPPLLSFADAVTTAALVDGVILVLDAKRDRLSTLRRCRRELETVGAGIVGTVVYNMDPEKADAFDARAPLPPSPHRPALPPPTATEGILHEDRRSLPSRGTPYPGA
jgi:capsular exopolysaccharide synthesis family protein